MASDNGDIHCRGCGRRFGSVLSDRFFVAFCSDLCARAPSLGENEERDAVIVMLAREGLNPTQLAVRFDLTRQRTSQIVKEGGVR